jgi:hypothetical protein
MHTDIPNQGMDLGEVLESCSSIPATNLALSTCLIWPCLSASNRPVKSLRSAKGYRLMFGSRYGRFLP